MAAFAFSTLPVFSTNDRSFRIAWSLGLLSAAWETLYTGLTFSAQGPFCPCPSV